MSDRLQRVGIDGHFSSWQDILDGVPQGSILGPLLFNIYINDFLFEKEEWGHSNVGLCNYADDNTFFASGVSFEIIKKKLESVFSLAALWFSRNGLQLNASKCKFIIFGKQQNEHNRHLCLSGEMLEETLSVKLLGVTLDNRLSFTEYIGSLCKKATAKVHALRRISHFLSESQRNLLASSFVISEFGYCPLVWGFSSRSSVMKINRIISRSGYSIDRSHDASGSFDIHRMHCMTLLREIYKTKMGLNPEYMGDVFPFRADMGYCLRSGDTLNRRRIRTVRDGLQTPSYIGAQLWDSLEPSIKAAPDLKAFCSGILTSNLDCRCRICACYVQNLGFIN